MIPVTFTTQEHAALNELLDAAVRARGLIVAEACIVLVRKLGEAKTLAEAAVAAAATVEAEPAKQEGSE